MEQNANETQAVAASVENQPPIEKQETSVLTQEQVDARIAEAVEAERRRQSGYMKQINELTGVKSAYESLKQEHEQMQSSYRELQEAQDKLDYDQAQKTPDMLQVYKSKLALREAQDKFKRERAEFERQRQEFEEDRKVARTYRETSRIQTIATEFGVPIERLSAYKHLPDEDLKRIAKDLQGTTTPASKPVTAKPDSGTGIPVGRRTFAQVEQDYADGKINYAEYAKARKERGLN
jgi:DNA repair exonuclease SbcCD ATPase subunit